MGRRDRERRERVRTGLEPGYRDRTQVGDWETIAAQEAMRFVVGSLFGAVPPKEESAQKLREGHDGCCRT